MSMSAIKAGEAFVEAYLEKSRLYRDMRAVSAQMSTWGKSITNIGAGVLGAGLGITAPLAAAVGVFAEMGGNLEDMSARTGVSVSALSELGFAANQTGASMETVEGSIKKMQKAISEADDGSTSMADSLAQIGLSAEELKGLKPEDQFAIIAKAISKVEDPARRTQAAMALFGKSGTQLLPMIQNLDDLTARARELGLTMSGEDTAAADAFGDSLDELWAVGKKTAFTIGAALAPSLQGLVTWLSDSAGAASRWINENRGIVTLAAGAGVALVGAGAGLMGFGVALRTVAPALTLVKMGVSGIIGVATAAGPALAGAFAVLASPLGLTLAGVTALAVGFFTLTDAGKQMTSDMAGSFEQLKTDAVTAFEGIKGALSAGDFQKAAEILWAGLELVWEQGKSAISGVWADVVEVMTVAWNNAIAFIGSAWDGLMNKLREGQNILAQAVASVGESVGLFAEGTGQTLLEDQQMARDNANEQTARREAERQKKLSADNMAAFEANNKRKAELEKSLADKRAEFERLAMEGKTAAVPAAVATPNGTIGDDIVEAVSRAKKELTFGGFDVSAIGQMTGSNHLEKVSKSSERSANAAERSETHLRRVAQKLDNVRAIAFTP